MVSHLQKIYSISLILLSTLSTFIFLWISISSLHSTHDQIYALSLCLLVPHYVLSLKLYRQCYSINQDCILMLISMPFISPLFPYFYRIFNRNIKYTNPNITLSKLLQWRLELKYQHFGFIIHCISQILIHCILIIIKINIDGISNNNLLYAMLIYLLYISLTILPLFHSINITLLIFNWFSWLLDFNAYSIIMFYLYELYITKSSNIYLALYIIGMIQYSVYLLGFAFTL
eukprot:477718_1